MKVIETTVFVDERGQCTLQLPKGIAPGRHRVVVVVDEIINEYETGVAKNIDTAFVEMADDVEYQAEALQIEREFSAVR